MAELRYKRVLLKISGEALMGKQTYGIDMSVADRLAAKGTRKNLAAAEAGETDGSVFDD